MKTIFKFQWKRFLRNKIALYSWLGMLAIGCYAIYYGQNFQQSQLHTIMQLDTAYQSRLALQLDKYQRDTTVKEGLTEFKNASDAFMNEYALKPVVWKSPSPLQSLSIGQSDNQPFYYSIWVYNNVYNNKVSEIRNPAKLRAGNFDLAFVLIYLLPLLLIAYSFNAAGEDDENGITKLLAAQGYSIHRLLVYRLCFYGLLVISLGVLLSILGLLSSGGFSSLNSLGWLMLTVIYLVFWLAVCYGIVAIVRNSSGSALALVGIWVILNLLVPSAIQQLQHQHDPHGLEIADADREFGAKLWNMDKNKLIDTLFEIRPDLKKYGVNDTNTVRSIAYSYLNMRNMSATGQLLDSLNAVEQQKISDLNYFNPIFSAQLLYNQLAASELEDFIKFRKDVSHYQLQRIEKINYFRLSGNNFTKKDLIGFPVFEQQQKVIGLLGIAKGITPLLIITSLMTLMGGMAWSIRSKNKYRQ